ncbi:MAG TPA: nucleotidyltransferase domain-containing protein [Flavisolibacter sp.]|nr:nucleotidyltransferase domain-containing protein [Flavisolibacter sp.]
METIKQKLEQIEADHKIKILYACETGSRAWGFPSPDSDYDVRFIYQHERDWYLALNDRKDTIEFMDGDLDITGWDLRKCLKLLKKSNVPLIERFQSPVQYYADENFRAEFKQLIQAYYSPIASFFHHYSLANKFWEELKDQASIKLKSYFYLVRSLLSCNWIIKDKAVLPMDIESLMTYVDDKSREELQKLIALKATVGETYLHPKDATMQAFITRLFAFVEENKNDLGVNNKDFDSLNDFFLKTLYEKADN